MILLLSLLKVLIIIVKFMSLANLKQLIDSKKYIPDDCGYIRKCASRGINFKNRVCNYYFVNLIKAKKEKLRF